jgi:hypothetical protein
VVWALVPEAAIDEYGDTVANEDEIGLHLDLTCVEQQIFAKAQPIAMKPRAKQLFRLCVRSAVALHQRGDSCARRGRAG